MEEKEILVIACSSQEQTLIVYADGTYGCRNKDGFWGVKNSEWKVENGEFLFRHSRVGAWIDWGTSFDMKDIVEKIECELAARKIF